MREFFEYLQYVISLVKHSFHMYRKGYRGKRIGKELKPSSFEVKTPYGTGVKE